MAKHINPESFLTVGQTAKTLGISPNTLRTYSLLIEKETGNETFFARSQSGGRLYTNDQIQDLKTMIKVKQNGAETLKSAVQSVFSELTVPTVPVSVPNVPNGTGELYKVLKSLDKRGLEQDKQIKALTELVKKQGAQIKQLTRQNGELLDQVKSIGHNPSDSKDSTLTKRPQNGGKKEKKPGFWARLFLR